MYAHQHPYPPDDNNTNRQPGPNCETQDLILCNQIKWTRLGDIITGRAKSSKFKVSWNVELQKSSCLVICMTSTAAVSSDNWTTLHIVPYSRAGKVPQPISTKIGLQRREGLYVKNRPWLCHVGQKASLKLTIPPSSTDKTHFPFITLYHKHKSTGKWGLEVVKPVPGFLFQGSIYLMIYISFGKWKKLFCFQQEGHW